MTQPSPRVVNTNIHIWDTHDLTQVVSSNMSVGGDETIVMKLGERATIFCSPKAALHVARELRIAAGAEERPSEPVT